MMDVKDKLGCLRIDVKDKPGCLSKELMRKYFEGAITQTAVLKATTPLGTITVNGEFSHYADSNTDTMWLGFALGMRCCERIAKAGDGERQQPNTNSGTDPVA